MSELDQAVRAVVRDCLGVREGEDVLVICNPATQGLGERLRAEAQAVGAEGVLSVMAERAPDALFVVDDQYAAQHGFQRTVL